MVERFAFVILLWLSTAMHAVEVETTEGVLRGAAEDHELAVFRGVPFATPPIGDRRWRPPLPHPGWTGTRDALTPGTACWQERTPEDWVYSRGLDLEVSEDCLYLNVWSPIDTSEARAVMVWFHGGANTMGHGSSRIFDGANLARLGVVVVTANYRMGPFGFFAHPDLVDESEHASAGNYGLLDQIEVLQWVKRNISAFGGDPDRVTIFGQSAGALDVCALMASKLASGLMHGVIAQSGTCLGVGETLDEASKKATAITDAGIDDLRARSSDEIGELFAPYSSPIIVDGWVLEDRPTDLFASGDFNQVPLMLGALADEMKGLSPETPETSMEDFDLQLARIFGSASADAKMAYGDALAVSTADATHAIGGDRAFVAPARKMARLTRGHGVATYLYHFDQDVPVFRLYLHDRPLFDGKTAPRSHGAYHSGELAYVFSNLALLGAGWNHSDRAIGRAMSRYWTSFAKTGDPNTPGQAHWPSFDTDEQVMLFANPIGARDHPSRERLDVIDRVQSR